MTRCAVKRGFFVLRDCDDMAANYCNTCSRPMCFQHSVFSEQGLFCVECNSRTQEENGEEEHDESNGEGEYDENWAYSYRHSYYSESDYDPFYTGRRHDSYYDDYDVRAFDKKEGDSLEDDEEGGEGFFDS